VPKYNQLAEQQRPQSDRTRFCGDYSSILPDDLSLFFFHVLVALLDKQLTSINI
jgi:hypothetical protein